MSLLILAALFCGQTLVQKVMTGRAVTKSAAAIEIDRAELILRLNDSLLAVSNTTFSHKSSFFEGAASKKLEHEALAILKETIKETPDNPVILAKAFIASQYSGVNAGECLQRLKTLPTDKAHKLAGLLTTIYQGNPLSLPVAREAQQVLETILPAGWYQDQAKIKLYSNVLDKHIYEELKHGLIVRELAFFTRLIFLVAFGTALIFVGTIVLIGQFLFLKRPTKADQEQIKAPADYGWFKVLAVFTAWLATQLIVSLFAQSMIKPLITQPPNMLLIASVTTCVYLISNGPTLLYIYFFALKPSGLKFREALKLKWGKGSAGLGALIGAGVLTWLAAIPMMLIVYYLANEYFGCRGSSNPIIAIVTEAARHENWPAAILFYLTLGGLAPICEETLFRGFLYTYLRRRFGVLPSACLSAALFSIAHLDPGAIAPLFCLGCAFAFVLERTKSLVPAIVAHGLWNSCTFTLVLLLFGN